MSQPSECGNCSYDYEEDCSYGGCQIQKAEKEEHDASK